MDTYGGPCQICGGPNQGYMVNSWVWFKLAGLYTGFTCLGCLEKLIGRKLVRADFTNAPINYFKPVKKWLKEVY